YNRFGLCFTITTTTTRIIATTIINRSINIFGMPKNILADNGSGFGSKVMRVIMKLLGINIRYSLPNHPQSNGICERLNGTIVSILTSYTIDDHATWSKLSHSLCIQHQHSYHHRLFPLLSHV